MMLVLGLLRLNPNLTLICINDTVAWNLTMGTEFINNNSLLRAGGGTSQRVLTGALGLTNSFAGAATGNLGLFGSGLAQSQFGFGVPGFANQYTGNTTTSPALNTYYQTLAKLPLYQAIAQTLAQEGPKLIDWLTGLFSKGGGSSSKDKPSNQSGPSGCSSCGGGHTPNPSTTPEATKPKETSSSSESTPKE